MILLDHGPHLVAGYKELRLRMRGEHFQMKVVQDFPNLLGALQGPTLVLRKLKALIAHVRDGGEGPVEVLPPIS